MVYTFEINREIASCLDCPLRAEASIIEHINLNCDQLTGTSMITRVISICNLTGEEIIKPRKLEDCKNLGRGIQCQY